MDSLFRTIGRASRLAYVATRAARRTGAAQRLTFVQFGDYAEAARRFEAGGEENYYAQRYTVEFVAGLSARGIEVTVICVSTDEAPAVMRSGVRTLGVRVYPEAGPSRFSELAAAIERSNPTHLVCAAPLVPVLRWALRAGVPVLPLFADSFRERGLRSRLRSLRLAHVLNDPRIELVANHNLASSLDLARIGVDRAKVVPFDWPALIAPTDYEPKRSPGVSAAWRVLYVGQIVRTKGVGEAIEGVAMLGARGVDVALTVIGGGDDVERLRGLAEARGVVSKVHFAGKMPHRQVLAEMRAHHVVTVPSHHEYPEGLPMTLYEALSTRTPIVASDHPMFALRIRDGRNAVTFRAGDSADFARALESLVRDESLYERLSVDAEREAQGYLCPLKWDALIGTWLEGSRSHELAAHSLARDPAARA